MKFSHLWQYLAKFFLKREMFQIKVVDEMKIHILCSVSFSRKSYRLWDNIEKCSGAREAADGNMRCVACWISNGTRAQAHARARTPTLTHTQTRTRARASERTPHTRPRTQKYVVLFFHGKVVLWTRLKVTLYVHFACLVCFNGISSTCDVRYFNEVVTRIPCLS
jgi:hypothetical protein